MGQMPMEGKEALRRHGFPVGFDFIRNWIAVATTGGYKFHFGLFEISDHGMRLIAKAMGSNPGTLRF